MRAGPLMESGILRKITGNGLEFIFELNCKREHDLGSVQVDHWWMPITPLYGQRRGSKPLNRNFVEILRVYWHAMQQRGATGIRDAQERYLLAALVPDVRAEGSRNIFDDAFLRPMSQKKQKVAVRALDAEILRPGKDGRLGRAEFSEKAWQLLGITELSDTIRRNYNQQLAQALDEPCALLGNSDPDDAIRLARMQWRRLMQGVGRRGGEAEKKVALNVISYEARAALHHCYSVTWITLIWALESERELDPLSAAFLRLWHTVDEESDSVPLFHGHVLALHPATGPFLLSRTGATLVGEWLNSPDSTETFERLLNGLYLALVNYYMQRASAAENRSTPEFSTGDIQVVEELQCERRQGIRRPRKPLP